MTDLRTRTESGLLQGPGVGAPVSLGPAVRRRKSRKGLMNIGLGVALAGGVLVAYALVGSPSVPKAAPRTATVAQGVVQSSVSATGNVAVAADLTVNFPVAGKLLEVDVAVGDRVTRGQVLARTDPFAVQGTLKTAQANLSSARARLVQLQSSLSTEELAQANISIQQGAAQLDSSNAAVANAQSTASQNAVSTQSAINQAVATFNTDQAQLASDQNQQNADQNAAVAAQNQQNADQAVVDADQARVTADQTRQFVDGCTSGGGPSSTGSAQGSTTATTVSVCPTDAFALQQDQARLSQDQAALSTAKANSTAATNAVTGDSTKIATDQAKLVTDQNAITNARNSQTSGQLKDGQAIQLAQYASNNAQLSYQAAIAAGQVKIQPPKVGDLTAAQAAVASAQVTVETAQKAVDDTTLVAPSDGTVATLNGVVGQSVSGGGAAAATASATTGAASSATSSTFLTLANLSTLQVKAGLTETDSAKVKVGQPATVTLAALPGLGLAAHVASIDATATVVSNVVTYNAVLLLDRTGDGVKPGMTAAVSIVVAERPSALRVPTAAVRGGGGNTTVSVLTGGQTKITPVVVGLRGDDAVEIVSGLKAGDAVVISSGVTATAGAPGTTPAGRLPTGGAGFGGTGAGVAGGGAGR